jgi:hypothetical protein
MQNEESRKGLNLDLRGPRGSPFGPFLDSTFCILHFYLRSSEQIEQRAQVLRHRRFE